MEAIASYFLTKLGKKKDVDIVVDYFYEKLLVKIYKTSFVRVLNNLISNACKYTFKGTIQVGFLCLDDYLICYVQDSGIGISEAKLPRVFCSFEKLDTVAEGFGLGMAICKEIVGSLGGTINVLSTEGEGSLFYLYRKAEILIQQENQNIEIQQKIQQKKAFFREIILKDEKEKL